MALNNHVENFTLDMAPGGIAPVLNVSQGDTGRAYTADMYWGGASYDVSGLTVRLRGRKRDNTVFDYALPAPSGTKVSFDLQDKEQVTIIPGNVECELVFTDSNSRVVGTANFVIIVEESPYDPNAISESEVTGLVDLISDQIGGAVDDWMETEAPTSPEFAASMQNATDAYLNEHGVAIEYDNILNPPTEKTFEAVKVSELSGATLYTGYYGSAYGTDRIGLAGGGNSVYNSYVYFTDEDFDLYISASDLASISYISLCVVEDAGTIENYEIVGKSGTAVRYRNSDSNMPTVGNPLHIKAGSALIFTETGTANNWTYYIDDFYTLKENVNLNNGQVEQVKNSIVDLVDTRKCKVKYVNAGGEDNSTERLEVFIPSVVGFVKYNFVHTVNASINANVWRISYAYACDDNLSTRFNLTTSGEWEAALLLKTRPDFSGGAAHGDEVFTSIVFLLDGSPVSVSDLSNYTEFETLSIVERSNLYDPNDNETVIAEHGSEHIFSKDGLTIDQSVKWVAAAEASTCYMAMFPIAKTVSNKLFCNSDFVVMSLPQEITKEKTTGAVLYSDTLGVKAEFSVDKHPSLYSTSPIFKCTDNSGGDYNKCYYVVCYSVNVSANELWRSTTKYKFTISE